MDRRNIGFATSLTVLLAVSASLASAQQVFVVGPPGPGVFSQEFQPAIDAASDGDIILVKQVGFGTWSISDKSLTIVGDTGQKPELAYGVINISAAHTVTMRGLSILNNVTVSNSSGPVWLEDLLIHPMPAIGHTANITVTDSASVTIQRCVIDYSIAPFESFPGLTSKNSHVYAHSCTFRGGLGGGVGAWVQGGRLFASGSVFIGGDGAIWASAAGGAGLINAGAAVLLDSSMHGGSGSSGPNGYGPNGAPFVGTPPATIAGIAHKFSITSPVRESATATITAFGAPGELAGAYFSTEPMAGTLELPFAGALLANPVGAVTMLIGQIGSNGVIAVHVVAPQLPPAVMGATVYAQSFFFDSPLTYVALGPVSAVTVLDSSL